MLQRFRRPDLIPRASTAAAASSSAVPAEKTEIEQANEADGFARRLFARWEKGESACAQMKWYPAATEQRHDPITCKAVGRSSPASRSSGTGVP